MGLFVEHIAHEKCGSSDALAVYQEGETFNAYCFSCGEGVSDPYKDGARPKPRIRKSPEEIQAILEEIANYPIMAAPERGLTLETMEHFGIRTGLSEYDGQTPLYHYFPYTTNGKITGYKVRFLPEKRMFVVGEVKDADLFGWERALDQGAQTLFITEGEYDAPSLWQALRQKQRGTKWDHLSPSCTSLIKGAKSAKKDLSRLRLKINQHFEKVVLVYDMDEEGRAAVQDTMQIYPSAQVASLPSKDANQCLVDGRALALAHAVLFKKAEPKKTRLVWGSKLHELGRQRPKPGMSWPWQGITDMTRGLRYGETLYIGAGVKMGKSEVVNTLAAHLLIEHQLKVFLAKPEEAIGKTYKLVCSKVAGKIFHDPRVEMDLDAYDAASALVGDNLCVLDLYQHLGWNSLRSDVLEAAAEGCKAVFIDPITNLTNGIASGDANTVLQEISQDLSAIAKDKELLIFIFCHLKAPEGGPPHERGGKVYSHQFAGSRAMMRSCNYMLALEGNKDPDLPIEQRNMRDLVLLEDREFGEVGRVPLYWDHKTGLFNEVPR